MQLAHPYISKRKQNELRLSSITLPHGTCMAPSATAPLSYYQGSVLCLESSAVSDCPSVLTRDHAQPQQRPGPWTTAPTCFLGSPMQLYLSFPLPCKKLMCKSCLVQLGACGPKPGNIATNIIFLHCLPVHVHHAPCNQSVPIKTRSCLVPRVRGSLSSTL